MEEAERLRSAVADVGTREDEDEAGGIGPTVAEPEERGWKFVAGGALAETPPGAREDEDVADPESRGGALAVGGALAEAAPDARFVH